MNSVSLIGRLTRDPELRNGTKPVAKLRVAIPRRKKQGDDQGAVFIDVTTFDRQAELCAEYLSQGRQVAVIGRLEYSEWTDDDGGKHSKHEVIADNVEFLGGPPAGASEEPSAAELAAIGAEEAGPDF